MARIGTDRPIRRLSTHCSFRPSTGASRSGSRLPKLSKHEPPKPFIGSANGSASRTRNVLGHITAVDADSGKVIWTNDTDTPMVASVTPTAGSLILTGDTKGKFYPIGRDERDCSAEEGFGRSHWRRRGYLHARRNSVCGGRGRHEEPHRLDRRESRSFASRSTKAVSLSEIATFWTLERMLSRVLLCMTVVGMMITCARIQCAHGGIPND